MLQCKCNRTRSTQVSHANIGLIPTATSVEPNTYTGNNEKVQGGYFICPPPAAPDMSPAAVRHHQRPRHARSCFPLINTNTVTQFCKSCYYNTQNVQGLPKHECGTYTHTLMRCPTREKSLGHEKNATHKHGLYTARISTNRHLFTLARVPSGSGGHHINSTYNVLYFIHKKKPGPKHKRWDERSNHE